MLITYASIAHMTRAGFLSANTVYLPHLHYVIYQIGENKNKLTFETSEKEIKK